jgi:hypothetical protein
METIELLRAAIAATNPKPDAVVCNTNELPVTSIDGVQVYYDCGLINLPYMPMWTNPRHATYENHAAWWRAIHAARSKHTS